MISSTNPPMLQINAAPKAAQPAVDPELRKAAQGFEAVFLREIIGSMRDAKLGDDIFGSSATDNFRQMADANLADNMSQMGQFGISGMIEQQFAKLLKEAADE